MMPSAALLAALLLVPWLLVLLSVWLRRRRASVRSSSRPVCLVVLGSGGHTAEMFYDLRSLGPLVKELSFTFLIAATDRGSFSHAEAFASDFGLGPVHAVYVPRAREVGQSYVSSVFTTLRAQWAALLYVWRLMPDLVLTNGPGTCVPVVAAGLLCRFVAGARAATIYSESFARSENLSLSGRILYPLVDAFTVQWEHLLPLYPIARYAGFRSRPGGDGALAPLPAPTSEGPPTAIVTVGSTRFDELIRTVDDPAFLEILQEAGIRRLVIQKGAGEYLPQRIATAGGLDIEVLEYSPQLPKRIRDAALVISHAGAGTIMDCLLSGRRLVVVPNEALMDNHQIQLGMALQDAGLLLCFPPRQLLEGLRQADLDSLRCFPRAASPVFARCVQELLPPRPSR